MSSASQLRSTIRHPAVNRHIEALEAIERLADLGRRGRDPVAALKEIRAAALASLGRQETPPLPRLFVRVTSAAQDDWYAESVGEVFEVRALRQRLRARHRLRPRLFRALVPHRQARRRGGPMTAVRIEATIRRDRLRVIARIVATEGDRIVSAVQSMFPASPTAQREAVAWCRRKGVTEFRITH